MSGSSTHGIAMGRMPRDPVRVGVIGVGRFGENHVRAYAESPYSELVAIADVDAGRTHDVATKYGVERSFEDHEALLAWTHVQAVSIATPAHLHTELAIAAAEAGKHILLEKPIATTLQDAVAIVEAARKNRVKLMVGHMLRFEVNCTAIHSALAEGTMGSPVAVISRFNNPSTEARYAGQHVSPILHMMIHTIDLSLWYMNSVPTRVFCTAARGRVHAELNHLDGCVVTIDFQDGGLAVAESFWCLPERYANWRVPQTWAPLVSDMQLEVLCTDGVLYLDAPVTRLRMCDSEGWKFPQTTFRPIVRGELHGAFREEIRQFLICCMGRREPLVNGEDAISALRVALAAEESLKSNAPVMLM
jgi:UDP-N-acetylglucosamine 3-dehydrogenase